MYNKYIIYPFFSLLFLVALFRSANSDSNSEKVFILDNLTSNWLITDFPNNITTRKSLMRLKNIRFNPYYSLEFFRTKMSSDIPKQEVDCRNDLVSLGAEYSILTKIVDKKGCKVDYPIKLTKMTPEIDIAPSAVLNCPMARALARFFSKTAKTIALETMGVSFSRIQHVSAYSCRKINKTKKLSEHAFGNALDIRAFEFIDGSVVEVKVLEDVHSKEAKFLKKIRKAACDSFKTVIGPGTNKDHATHFHWDLKQRANNYIYCN